MIQFDDKKGDIYQILSFCLGHLKRKILLLLKAFLNDNNLSSKTQLITELAKQQSSCEQYILLLKQGKQSLFRKEDEMQFLFYWQRLYQRFVYRIKQLIRNYLPHASVSHQLFVYLKKIETYSFKQNYKFEEYILFILEENPSTLQKYLHAEMQQLKKNQLSIRNSSRRYDRMSPQQSFGRISGMNKDFKKMSLIMSSNLRSQIQSSSYQTLISTENQSRPIDIFNKSIKPVADCLDCDITIIRGVYFNLQKEKELINFSKNYQSTFTITKTVRDIYEEMLYQNRFIKDTITNFDKQHARYSIRLEKEPDFYKKQRKRCQTAAGTRRKHNFSILPDHTGQIIAQIKPKSQTKKKFETLNNNPTEQEKQEMYREIQKRKNTVLKMKSISISANKGHLELCSESKEQSKKLSLTFGNMKRMMNHNSKNVAINLKKKYEMFLNNNGIQKQKNFKETLTVDRDKTISFQQNNFLKNPRPFSSTISHTQKIQWIESAPIVLKKSPSKQKSKQLPQFDIQIQLSSPNYNTNVKQTIITEYLEPRHKIVTLRKNINSRLSSDDPNQLSQTIGKLNKVQHDFDITIKNFMKGGNVNHRNYANLQHKEKKLFETINPQLTVKTIKKT